MAAPRSFRSPFASPSLTGMYTPLDMTRHGRGMRGQPTSSARLVHSGAVRQPTSSARLAHRHNPFLPSSAQASEREYGESLYDA